MRIELTVNNESVEAEVSPRINLVDFLRQQLGLTGSHVGCEHGVCGACTVQVEGRIVRGCLMLAVQADQLSVQTIEGLSDQGELIALQQAFHQHNALQCGFCTPGMLLTAHALLAEQQEQSPPLSRDQIRQHISGNYCRCTGYESIVDAIEQCMREKASS